MKQNEKKKKCLLVGTGQHCHSTRFNKNVLIWGSIPSFRCQIWPFPFISPRFLEIRRHLEEEGDKRAETEENRARNFW